MEPDPGSAAFWQGLYDRSDRWELGRPTPPLAAQLGRRPRPEVPWRSPAAAAVTTRGSSRERAIGSSASTSSRRSSASRASWPRPRESTSPSRTLTCSLWPGPIPVLRRDLGVSSYCAIDPARRAEYVEILAAILKPGGWLLACFFPMGDKPGGPPFGVSEAEVRRLLAGAGFEILEDYAGRALDGRQGREWMVSARLRESVAR